MITTHQRHPYTHRSIVLLLATLLLMAGCGENEEQRQKRLAQERLLEAQGMEAALKIAVTPTIDCLPLYLLRDSLLYDTALVDVRLLPYTAHMDGDTALLRRHVEGMATDLVRVERLRRTGHPMATVTATEAHWQLLGNKHARLKTVSQLCDRLIAMTRFSATDLLTDRAAKKGKLKYQAYKVQINDVNVRLQMLLNNELDALWLMEPQATVARQAGANVLMDTRQDSLSLGTLAFRVDVMADDSRYRQIEALLKAYDRAVDLLNSRGVKAFAPLIEKYMGVDGKTVDALPTIHFQRSQQPLPKDAALAASYK